MKHRLLIITLLFFQFSFSQSGLELNLDSLFSTNGVSRVHSSTWIHTDSNRTFLDSFPNLYVLDKSGRIVSRFYGIGMMVYETKSYLDDKLVREICFESITKGSRHIYTDSLACLDTTEYKDTFFVKTYEYNEQGKLASTFKAGFFKDEGVEYIYNDAGSLDRTVLTTIEYQDTSTFVSQLYIYTAKGRLQEIQLFDHRSDIPSEVWTYSWRRNGKVKSIKVTYLDNENYDLYVYDKKGLIEREIYIQKDQHGKVNQRGIVTYYRDKNGLILRRSSYNSKNDNLTTISYYYYE